MSPDTAKRLALVFPTAFGQETGVTGVAGVADETRYARKPQDNTPVTPATPRKRQCRKEDK